MRWKKKNLTLESFIRFSFWNPSLLLQKKEFLLRFLYAFGFCNQAKSLTLTLKIFLVFLCEAAANQLQQSRDCCGVSYVLGFMQRSKPHTGIRASNWLVTYLGAMHQKRNCHYTTSPIGYWDKGSTIDWYKVLELLYL